jgi:hypothetical protein
MNPRVRVIKHSNEKSKESEINRSEQPDPQSTRDVTTTIKQWVSDFKARRRGQVLKLN